MKQILGIILILSSFFIALYVALWLCFIGGIVDVINGIKASPVDAMDIAVGLLRFFSTFIAGWISFGVIFTTGIFLAFPGAKVTVKRKGRAL
jgi:hypothetical protein